MSIVKGNCSQTAMRRFCVFQHNIIVIIIIMYNKSVLQKQQ